MDRPSLFYLLALNSSISQQPVEGLSLFWKAERTFVAPSEERL